MTLLTGITRAAVGPAMLLASIAALAQDAADLPTVSILACATVCAQSTPAVTTDSAKAIYPASAQRDSVEAFIFARYTVGVDGNVKDAVILHQVGPKEFADYAISALKARKFAPATLNGKPVEQSLTFQEVFSLRGKLYARDEVYKAYNETRKLITEGKYDEASTALTRVRADPQLNFYERGMLANLMAAIALHDKDYVGARKIVELPTTFFASEVPGDTQHSLLRERLAADLGTGDIADAKRFLTFFQHSKGFDPADPIVKMVEDQYAIVNAAPQFAISKKISETVEGGPDYFPLNRRNFTFVTNSGSLEKFSMNCRQQTIESKITDKAEWHVPKDWDSCYILVEGAPGTSYEFIQSNE